MLAFTSNFTTGSLKHIPFLICVYDLETQMKLMPTAKIKSSKHSSTASLSLHCCVCAVQVHVHVCMLESDTGHLTLSLSTLLWGQDLSQNPEFIVSSTPTSQRAPGILLSQPPQYPDYKYTPLVPILGPGDPHSLMLVQQTCHRLTRLPSLKLLCFKLLIHSKF